MRSKRDCRVAIIGAGITGMACARRLRDAGLQPTVFEKSRGLGGRMATRRVSPDLAFDHGVQYMTARSPVFQEVIDNAVEAGAAAIWRPVGRESCGSGAGPWVTGTPAMNAVVKPWSQGLDLRLSCQVAAIRRAASGWRVVLAPDQSEEHFDFVVVSTPAPQATALLQSEGRLSEALAGVSIAPCWATMVAFEQRLEPGFDVWRSETGNLSWMARNGSKPHRASSLDSWVIHASPDWSQLHLELEREDVVGKTLDMFRSVLGQSLPDIAYATAHRWRYARTQRPLGESFLASEESTLLVGGDWCLGARVEAGYESGLAMGEAIASALK